MQIETDVEVKYRTTLGDSMDDDTPEKEINEIVEQHIRDFCEEHDISRDSVKILEEPTPQSDVEKRFRTLVMELENVELTKENTKIIEAFLRSL